MSSIVLNRVFLATVLFFATAALATDKPPSILREPILGLRYEAAKVKFDPLPAEARAMCATLADDENSSAVLYLYGQASDASGRKFYVTSGYEIRHNVPKHVKYETDGLGAVFSTEGGDCNIIDSARQVFDDRLFDEDLPQPILKALAGDFALRLVRAFGSAERLRTEMRNQKVAPEQLPPELAEALKPYFAPAASKR